ncbi:7-carboxy-7-deazaguanine synthase [Aestuariirhabdus litorea]|uniref:7-carboxy-7-deazaguanine synthase n=1 Tax=Aestuariirhabdus litorea TaxID=2528527 RepID=A0A3P3VMG5_9GAMM|nr:7-carboxy-7-deazaguanine synthase [Aestuariirhabdus litorea]RRJ82856.1 7-carboxy-7-deazaguanine synthase [Aestuariirhabdus litorea]RWW93016.1 7-carboxy-7-deazaguanine synthase [Endozoicomonadaceae bacterium GTF-13]
MYSIKEAFYSLQGEGAHSGRPAVFCRFSGCNLWSGRERDRAGAVCDFCDTAFVGSDGQNGGKFRDADQLARHLRSLWPTLNGPGIPYVILTGGEPALQLDPALVDALHTQGFEVAIETNGTRPLPQGIDWVCVSPKGNTELVVTEGDELKLVYPQPQALPGRFDKMKFSHFYLQPMASVAGLAGQPGDETALRSTIDYCLQHPQWRLSLQTHKMIGIE